MNKLFTVFFIFFAIISFSQNTELFKPDSVKRIIQGTQINSFIKVDGVLNDQEWKFSKPVSDFIQIEPNQGEKANHKTVLSVLYNSKYLYIGVFAQDSLGKKAIRATDFKRDFDFKQHDLITIAIDGFNDNRNSMAIVVNPYGVQRDLLAFDDIYYNLEWDGLWDVRCTRSDSGWVAEFAIPWKTLRYPLTENQIQNWGFNIYRNRRMTNEISAFSPFPRSVSILRMAYAGKLTNLKPPPPSPNIRIQPYLLKSLNNSNNENNVESLNENNFKIGGEIKWVINPNSVFDLTFNTDFAQADVDEQVNNLTRFSVFFPEKRQFFLEDASLFGIAGSPRSDGTGGKFRVQPFFSRKIGLGDDGRPIPIDAGARYVNRSAKNNYGFMAMRQRKLEQLPAINFFIGRYTKNFGKQNRIGSLFLLKNTNNGTYLTNTVDGFLRLGQPHSINALFMHTFSDLDRKAGFSGYSQYYYSTNTWKAWWSQSFVTSDFKPEMGFVSRKDIIGTTPGLIWHYRGNKLFLKKYIRAIEPSINLEIYHRLSSGRPMEKQLNIRPVYFNLQSGAFAGYSFLIFNQNIEEEFTPLGITINEGEYNYARHQIRFSSDPSKILNLLADVSWGNFYDGKLGSYNVAFQFVPIPHISFFGRIDKNNFIEIGEKKITKTIDLYSIKGRFAINPRIQLVGFFQENSENNSMNYNIRFSWEYKPLSFIYIVFNSRSFEDSQQLHHNGNQLITKISFLKQI